MLLPGEVVVLPAGAVVRGVVVGFVLLVVPEVMPPMFVVGDVLPIGGVVPVVVFGVVPGVVFGVVPDVVLGVMPDVALVGATVGEAGVAAPRELLVAVPGVTVGDVDGVHRPEVVGVVVLLPTDVLPMVLPVGFVDVLGVVEATGHGDAPVVAACGVGDVAGLIVLGAMPLFPVLPGLALPVVEGVLAPPVEVGADVCATAVAAAKHTTVTKISADLLMEFSSGLHSWDGETGRRGCSRGPARKQHAGNLGALKLSPRAAAHLKWGHARCGMRKRKAAGPQHRGDPQVTPFEPESPGSRRDPEERPVRRADEIRDKMLDKTLADSFPTSDPPSSIPDPSADDSMAPEKKTA